MDVTNCPGAAQPPERRCDLSLKRSESDPNEKRRSKLSLYFGEEGGDRSFIEGGCYMRSADGQNGNPPLEAFYLMRDHMVDHPAGAHYVLWNGPAFLDVGVPGGGFVRFPVMNLGMQWWLLTDGQGHQLPVAARYDQNGLAICWLPYDGPSPRRTPQVGGGLTDADYVRTLQNISASRYQGLMAAAWGIGGYSTYRHR